MVLVVTIAVLGVVGDSGTPAQANVALTRAEIEAILNRVELIQQGQSARMARHRDRMAVGDALRTAARSQAQLRFNDGSLARVGERATFQFLPNTRNFRLSNGTVLLLIPPGRGRSTIQTPSAITGIQGSALVVRHIEDRNLTIVMALTNNPAGPMTVTPLGCGEGEASDPCGTEYPIYAGQMALVHNHQVEILEFDLFTFYGTSSLVDGLELDNPDASVSLGPDLDPVRAETLEALSQVSNVDNMTVLNPEVVSVSPSSEISTGAPGSVVPEWSTPPEGQRPPSISPLLESLTGISPALPTNQSPPSSSPPQPPTNQPPTQPQRPVAQPPVSQPPAGVPTQPQRPIAQPPVSQPPTGVPTQPQRPVAQPPVSQPPTGVPTQPQRPIAQPPVNQPPTGVPTQPQRPIAQPPVSQPPTGVPTQPQRPIAQPPVNQPPTGVPTQPQRPIAQPPVSQPPTGVPTQPQRPIAQPPASQPPTGVPTQPQRPIAQPPISQPPANQPPVNQLPDRTPPQPQPPIAQPPIEQPPIAQPPIEQPPIAQPPVEQPPIAQPPIEQPPINLPPIDQPPDVSPLPNNPPDRPNGPRRPTVPASPPPFQENPTVPARPPANPPVIFQP